MYLSTTLHTKNNNIFIYHYQKWPHYFDIPNVCTKKAFELQSGVWLPFYRAHANMGTDRREPYLFPEDVQERIRTAIRQRYAHIPIFYTLFYEHYLTTSPVIRPLFYEYPSDANVVDIDDQLLVGQNILVRAVTEPGVSSVDVYLPGGSTSFWYDIDTPLMYTGSGWTNVAVTLDRVSSSL